MRVFYRHSRGITHFYPNGLCLSWAANPILAALLDKPRWQRWGLMSIALISLVGGAYGIIIRGLWQELQQVSQDIVQQHQTIAAQYRALHLRPIRAQVDEQRQALLAQEQSVLPLTQQIAAPLEASKARLKQWLPQPVAESGSPRSVLKMQMAYPALAVFLQKLLAGHTPPSIEQLSLNTASGTLDIDMLLSVSSYSPEQVTVPDVALSRDPFSQQAIKPCLEQHDELSQAVLKGIVGSDTRRTGWLAWPDGSWKKLRAGRPIVSTDWRVDSVAVDRIVLIRDAFVNEGAPCDERRKLMSLHPEKKS